MDDSYATQVGNDLQAGGERALERWVSKFREGLTGVLYLMSKKTRTSFFLAATAVVIDAAQFLTFALPPKWLMDLNLPPTLEVL